MALRLRSVQPYSLDSLEVDEATDVTNHPQISVILCYVAKTEADCEVKKALLGFDDVSEDRRAPAIAVCVLRRSTTVLKRL